MEMPFSDPLEDAIREFKELRPASALGAQNAWQGYELQTLYIASRLADNDGSILLPETIEDLLVVAPREGASELVELVQVKSASVHPLVLSQLNPKAATTSLEEDDSFFGHLWRCWKAGVDVSGRLVVFGALGQELADSSRRLEPGGSIRAKLLERGYPDDYCDWLSYHFTAESVDREELLGRLQEEFIHRPEAAASFELAFRWTNQYVRDASRNGTRITREAWSEQLARLGLEAAFSHGCSQQYGVRVLPFKELCATAEFDAQAAKERFRFGAKATPAHIAMKLDVARPLWCKEIDDAFASTPVVVVRGASGQGKSTLCYRWLMDNALERAYVLEGVTRSNAPEIAVSLRGLAKSTRDVAAYIEADANEGWLELAHEIGLLGAPGLRLLVSVREDDAARAGYSAGSVGASDIFLRLEESEAKELYAKFKSPFFPSFDAAWTSFGRRGPLMEFTYSLTHSQGLRDTLEAQVDHLRREGEDGWLKFLYLASDAGRFGLAASIPALAEAAGCHEVQKMLRLFEGEMLLRSDSRREVVLPLHPYRSELLAQILRPLLWEPEEELEIQAARCAVGDFSPILVSHFMSHPLGEVDLDGLLRLASSSWPGASSVLRALIWKDARDGYVTTNDIRTKLQELGLPPLLGYGFAASLARGGESASYRTCMGALGAAGLLDAGEPLIRTWSSCVFDQPSTDLFLSQFVGMLPVSACWDDWAGEAGLVLAYLGIRGFAGKLPDEQRTSLERAGGLDAIPLAAALDLLAGLDCLGVAVSEAERSRLLQRVCNRDSVVFCERFPGDDGASAIVRALFVPPLTDTTADGPEPSSPNGLIMRVVRDLRRVLPGCKEYQVRHVGLKALAGGLDIPDCEKRIPLDRLPLTCESLWGRYYSAMIALDYGPLEDWESLCKAALKAAGLAVKALESLSDLAQAWMNHGAGWRKRCVAADAAISAALESLELLEITEPKCSRDPLCFERPRFAIEVDDAALVEGGEAPESAGSILPKTKDFFFHVQNHLRTARAVMAWLVGESDSPNRAALVNVIMAAAEAPQAAEEFSHLFGVQLLTSGQVSQIQTSACLWNESWVRAPRSMAARRVKMVQAIPKKLVRSLQRKEPVREARLDGKTLRVRLGIENLHRAPALVVSCLKEVLPDTIREDSRLFEFWMLRESVLPETELVYEDDGAPLLKVTYRPYQLIDNLDSPDEMAILKVEFLSEADGARGSQAAAYSLGQGGFFERLCDMAQEVSSAIAEADSPGGIVISTFSVWCDELSDLMDLTTKETMQMAARSGVEEEGLEALRTELTRDKEEALRALDGFDAV